MPTDPWPFVTPGIPDSLFERLPGIPLTQRETRLLMLSYLRLEPESCLWDVGAGTGTIAVEAARLAHRGQVIAVERDEEVVDLIQRNCDRFGVNNVQIVAGSAPECFPQLEPPPQRICLEGGRPIKEVLLQAWEYLAPGGRLVAIAGSLENLYALSEGFATVQARSLEVVQSVINRLETRGGHRLFTAVEPIFILSGEKIS
ncbi:precorrin-6Y C5,15-methyltransferase subunit CbiT [Parathermosynechococcus lividus]|jgi:precorrin-6Y C5,15-methyltransferase (decarboxylating)/cobalt-precorrin-6B (C15)-methyltransferase|uniref:Precorrin-6Y C5,15-methyltransferase (Decarboxylating) subunit CbiT n=1 Tax=Parathermosynechococcus lividus PCC 6715 TaxID=1917166 RepID=A0A2D2PZ79_PARLV|nr:precorrin-6Y C5,15-methyltransferase subunit CbiT [Thermostichus lividus]ATS17543.1 precorrin-6Y C5,15-methyltransferase (decarboxylating) subunit CbiT [Thermostichus lividus PCC 6715]